jgi:hypothetical protein
MAMIDAYRIGVDLVLGGDLASGIEALIPALERLDTRITHANAETAELAAGLHEVAETAPGIGRAADQMGRLSDAMANVNQAVEAWRAHGGAPAAGVLAQAEESAGASPHLAAAGVVIGSPKDAAEFRHDLGFGEGRGGRFGPSERGLPDRGPDVPSVLGAAGRSGGPWKPPERSFSGIDSAMPALLAGELVKSNVAGRFDGETKDAALLTGGRAPALVPQVEVTRVSTLGADAAKSAPEVYAAASHALPVYARDALASGRSGPGAALEPMLGGDLTSVAEPGGHKFGGGRVEAVEEVMPTLTRRGAVGEALVEPHPFVPQPSRIIDDTLAPVVGVTGLDARTADPSLVVEDYANSLRALSAAGTAASERATQRHATIVDHALAASIGEASQGFGVGMTDGTPKGFPDISGDIKAALEGLLAGVVEAPRISDGTVGLSAPDGRRSLVTLGSDPAALNEAIGKMPDAWLSAARGAAAVGAHAPGAVGAGIAPSLTAPYRDLGGGSSVMPDSQGYHSRGDQPGPVIQHITYLHLDDREIARAVTRQQLRMMGGNVSGTLRPDPSIAPHYGAHLLET